MFASLLRQEKKGVREQDCCCNNINANNRNLKKISTMNLFYLYETIKHQKIIFNKTCERNMIIFQNNNKEALGT